LPVVAEISTDYQDEVTFLAVAGRGELDATTERAAELFGERLLWGLDDSVWDLYGVTGQPMTLLITGDDRVVQRWPGLLDETEIRDNLDRLVATAG
jgi:hypothetical protein